MTSSWSVPACMIALALLDVTLSGFRTAAGRDGRIDKRAYYVDAMRRGFLAGVLLCALLGLATALVVLARPDGAAIYADLVGIGERMLPVFAVFGAAVIVALGVYAVSRHEVRTFATVAILGPFTLARPFVVVGAAVHGVLGARSPFAVALTIVASGAVLGAERWLARVGARTTAWTRSGRGAAEGRRGARATDAAGASRPEGDEATDADRVHVVPIEASIDLHFFAPRDVPSVVDEYLREARRKRLVEVRLIHGKGKGVQRARVQKILSRHPAVESYRSDGTGSTIAQLRPRKRRDR